MKRLALFLIFLASFLIPATAYGQGSQRLGQLLSGDARPISGANVWACAGASPTWTPTATPPCTLTPIYSDPGLTMQITQPVVTDGLGNYNYYIAANTGYTEGYTGSSVSISQSPVTIIPPCVVGSTNTGCGSGGGGGGTPGSPAGSIQANTLGSFAGNASLSENTTGARTFANPLFGTFSSSAPYQFFDTSSYSSSPYASGDPGFLPYLDINIIANGSGDPLPMYTSVFGQSSTANHAGNASNLVSQYSVCAQAYGDRHSGCWGRNDGSELVSVYPTACSPSNPGSYCSGSVTNTTTRNGTSATVTLIPPVAYPTGGVYYAYPNPAALSVGDPVMISNCVNSTFDTVGIVYLSNVSGNTVTWPDTHSSGSTTGCTVALDDLLYGDEIDAANNLGDPGPLGGATSATTKFGLSVVSFGSFPIQAAYNSLETSSTNRPYQAYTCQDAIYACYSAGIIGSGSPVGQDIFSLTGFDANPIGIANPNGTANMPSMIYGFADNWGNGTQSADYGAGIQLIPTPNSTSPIHRLSFQFNGTEAASINQAGYLNGGLYALGSNPAQSGVWRLKNADTGCWRNIANSADDCLSIGSGDALYYNGNPVAIGTASFSVNGTPVSGPTLNNSTGATGLNCSNPSSNIVQCSLANSAGGGASALLGTVGSGLPGDVMAFNSSNVLTETTLGIPQVSVTSSPVGITTSQRGYMFQLGSGASALTVPQAGSTGFLANFDTSAIWNLSGGTVTLTPTTSTIQGGSGNAASGSSSVNILNNDLCTGLLSNPTGSGTYVLPCVDTVLLAPGPIGSTTANSGAFSTLSASSTVSGSGFSTYLASPPAIGGTSAAAGAFTTLSASSTVSGTGFSTYMASPPAIGGTAPAAVSATTLNAGSGDFTVNTSGLPTKSDNLTLAGVGFYSIVANVALTGQSYTVNNSATAVDLPTSTTLPAGLYRIDGVQTITTTFTGCTAVGVTFGWTDSGSAQTQTNPAGALTAGTANGLTGAIHSDGSAPITYTPVKTGSSCTGGASSMWISIARLGP